MRARSLWNLALVFVLLSGAMLGNCAPYATKFYSGKDVEISLYTPTMFRVRVSSLPGEKFPAKYEIPFAIGKIDSWPQVSARSWSEGDFDLIETSKLRIRISRIDHSWTVWSAGGDHRLYPSDGPTYGIFRDGYTEFDSASALGQASDHSRFAHWFYNAETKRYVDTFLGDDQIFDQYFIYGPDYPSLFSQLNELVGPEPLLPRKAFGFFQTQALGCHGSQSQLMETAQKLRERHIPADILIEDYEWGDGCPGGDGDPKKWGSQLDWSENYKQPLSPREMLAKLHEMHFDVMVIHHSVPDYPNGAEGVKRDPEGDWTSHAYDEKYWWSKMRDLLDIGVNGTWQDTRKNDVTDSVLYGGFQDISGESRRVLFMGNRDMMEENPWHMEQEREPVASLLASRRYPFRWTGDLHTTWSELQFQIDAITNTYGPMSGVDYITADAFGADWKQQARWNQFLSFTPVARSHSMKPWDISLDVKSLANIMAFGDKTRENGGDKAPDAAEVQRLAALHSQKVPTAENSIRKMLGLRYRLLPYIYSFAYEQYRTGYPIVRPMVLAFPDDLQCAYNRERYQYMFGDAFLVAPVWADLNSMDIYLPKGYDWIDYWTKEVHHGGQTISYDTSDVERLPLFVKAGSIIPMGQAAEWIDPAAAPGPLTIDIYPAEKPSAFTLYEDDGVTTRYQSGEYAKTSLKVSEEKGEIDVAIGAAIGEYKGKPESRRMALAINLLPQAPLKVLRNGAEMKMANNGDAWSYNPQNHTLQISFTKSASENTDIRIIRETR
jgi:alpha-glucosidase (family GH31 glycosyl hydrolase)